MPLTRVRRSDRITLWDGALALTDTPAAETEVQAPRFRALVDFSRYSQVRLLGNVSTIGSAGTVVRLQWAATAGGTYAEFAPTNLPAIPLDGAGGLADSGWVTIPAAAKNAEVYVRAATFGGNATADPVVSRVEALVR